MRTVFAVMAALGFVCLVASVSLQAGRERGYHDGFSAGYATPHPVTPEAKVVGNLLCRYAEVACPELELKARHVKPH